MASVTKGVRPSCVKPTMYDCNGGPNQQWHWVNGALQTANNKCLDIPASNVTNGNQLQIYDCNGTGAQNWTLP